MEPLEEFETFDAPVDAPAEEPTAAEQLIASIKSSRQPTELRRYESSAPRTGTRIVDSVSGPDGHAPLDVYGAPYVRGPSTGEYAGGVTGYEYRTRGPDGQYVPGDYAIVLRAADAPRGVISWAYMPVVDETRIDTETDTVAAVVDGKQEYQVVPVIDKEGQPVYRKPVVTQGVNLIIDGMLDMLVGAGLVHWYWRSLEELETDPGETAAEVRKNWPSDWAGDSGLTMLQIS
jgi:hypothetical protein